MYCNVLISLILQTKHCICNGVEESLCYLPYDLCDKNIIQFNNTDKAYLEKAYLRFI